MEIVSYGHIKAKREFCHKCGATIKYVPRDVQTFQPGTHRSKNYVRCPVCGSVIFVDVTFAKNDKYITFPKNDKYITFADVDEEEEEYVVKVKDLPFMQADMKTMSHNEVHDDDAHVAWQSGYLACLRAAQKQVRDAAGIEKEEV